MSDPLAAYRRPGGAASPRATENEAYRAFGTKERPARVDIRPTGGPSRAYLYTGISEICHDREGEGILLIMAGKMVKIIGRNLQAVAEALIIGNCAFIEELDPKGRMAEPAKAEPVIERIEIIGPRPAQKA